MKRSQLLRALAAAVATPFVGAPTPVKAQGPRGPETPPFPGLVRRPPLNRPDVYDVTAFGARVDGVTDDLGAIQAAIDAASAHGGGMVYVPSGAGVVSGQVNMRSSVHLVFGVGTYTNAGSSSGDFIHFAPTVSNSTVSGQGITATALKNSGTGPQFGSVVGDRGTYNGIADLTLDANENTTNTLTTERSLGFTIRNAKLIHSITIGEPLNYGWHIRGGSHYDVVGLELQGGSLAGIQMHADDRFGSCRFGRVSDLYVHDSRYNGIDCHALDTRNVIEGWIWTNVITVNNGGKDVGDDDEFGFYLFGSDTGEVRHNMVNGLITIGNSMHGFRMKGRVYGNSVNGLVSTGNGIGRGGGHGVSLVAGVVGDSPTANCLQGVARGAGADNSHALATESAVRWNLLLVDVGEDSISLGSNLNTVLTARELRLGGDTKPTDARPGKVQTLTDHGTIDVDSAVTHVVTIGRDSRLSMPDGVEGQRKSIVMTIHEGAATVFPASFANGSAIIFAGTGDSAELLFTNGSWHFMGGTAALA